MNIYLLAIVDGVSENYREGGALATLLCPEQYHKREFTQKSVLRAFLTLMIFNEAHSRVLRQGWPRDKRIFSL